MIVVGWKGLVGKVPCWSVGYRVEAAVLVVQGDRVVEHMPVVVDLGIAVRRVHVAMRLSGLYRLLHREVEASSHDAQWARELGGPPGCKQRLVRTVE